jgi:hypothetical protein
MVLTGLCLHFSGLSLELISLQTILTDGGGVLVSFTKFLFQSVEHTQDDSPIELKALLDTSRLVLVVKEDLGPKRDGNLLSSGNASGL